LSAELKWRGGTEDCFFWIHSGRWCCAIFEGANFLSYLQADFLSKKQVILSNSHASSCANQQAIQDTFFKAEQDSKQRAFFHTNKHSYEYTNVYTNKFANCVADEYSNRDAN
jgi:hypothetical protein